MPVIQCRGVLQSTAIAKCSSPVVPLNDEKKVIAILESRSIRLGVNVDEVMLVESRRR